MAFRTFFEWPGQMLSMMLEKWHDNIVVVGKNQAMKMMLEKSAEEFVPVEYITPWESVNEYLGFPNHPVVPRKTVVFNDEECKVVTADFGKIEEKVLALNIKSCATGRIDSRKENQANTPKSRSSDFEGVSTNSLTAMYTKDSAYQIHDRSTESNGVSTGRFERCTPNLEEIERIEQKVQLYEEAYGKDSGSEQGQQAQESQRQEESAGEGSIPAPEAGTETAGA